MKKFSFSILLGIFGFYQFMHHSMLTLLLLISSVITSVRLMG